MKKSQLRQIIKEEIGKILKEDTTKNPEPEELIPARVKSNGKEALALLNGEIPYAIAHPDISSLSRMFLKGKKDDATLCGWVKKKIKEKKFIEDLKGEGKLGLNEALDIDKKTIKPLSNCRFN